MHDYTIRILNKKSVSQCSDNAAEKKYSCYLTKYNVKLITENKMKNLKIVIVLMFLAFGSINLAAHCEIPCGIYEDSVRINLIRDHITTMEK